jgi:cell division protein FtsB
MDSLFFRKDRKPIDLRSVLRKALKNRRVVVALALGVPVMLFVLFGSRGVVQRLRLLHEKSVMETNVRTVEAKQRQLRAELKALDGDHAAIERVAREKHGMVREGETLYKVRRDNKDR